MDGNNRYPGGATNTEQWMPAPPPPPPMMSFTLPPPHPSVMWSGYNQSTFSYNDLAAATGGFAQANLLGQGGFGYVHKGVLPNGKEVAVKSLKQNSGQGEREFQAEVDIISRVHHRHLVSLVGYCISGSQRMLVYEFVPNSTLEDHLHAPESPPIQFSTRLKIALGSARGFAYLHEDCHPKIIHRDIKAANILLDNNFEAKVADFGLAKLSSETSTHISTRIMGTFGYLAPEYASSGKLTDKSDVYSFGIVLLELITGRRPVDITRDDDDDTLVDWARPILFNVVGEGGSYQELVDPRLENQYEHGEMLRMVTAAAACIRQSARKRPKMSQVVRALEGDVSLDDLQEVMKAQGSLSTSNSDYDLQRYQRMSPGLSNQNFSTAGSDLTDYSQSSSNEQRRPSPGFHYGS
ncbi:putative proline-rich receptor-like protein kinase PERK6 [Salvia splendens]|uniref:putative proline-rich receptor-like protein kinase PERK6 n=1 Tax=Salvia splendens TaxID=180675 RepID=UPI001C267CFC|nr:putative proline-rich receptor-like protein kinase PERK6 [Salvia splendens]